MATKLEHTEVFADNLGSMGITCAMANCTSPTADLVTLEDTDGDAAPTNGR